jgi:hypothetical protein
LICLAAISCGGGGSSLTGASGSSGTGTTTPPASNVLSVMVNGGPENNVNTLFTTVTVCVPGSTTNCQTIDGIQVDTGSFGLRLLASVLTLSLPVASAANGGSLVECTPFIDGYSWGPVALADIQVSGESASSVPIQIIGDSRFPTVPSDCSSAAPIPEDTVAEFGANGILGIGPFAQDCGNICVTTAVPAAYYSCTQTACENTTVAAASQVQNPVPLFATDNNGTIIVLPSVVIGGAASVTGSLIFGVDTESNNQVTGQTVLTLDPDTGYITTVFNSQTLNSSFIDSGSNGLYFNDSSIASCTEANFTDFYCPADTDNFTATLQGQNADGAGAGTAVTASFSVANAFTQAQDSPTFTVLPGLAGTNSGSGSFDWGLPFFYGRKVTTVIEGFTTSAGTGPYIAF